MWRTVALGDLCEFVRGPFGGSLKKNIFVSDGYAVYEQQHAINNQCADFRYFITEDKFREMQRFVVKPNDILMSCSGTIGKTTIVSSDAPLGIINQALLKITASEEVDTLFLKLFMQSSHFNAQLMNTVDGAAIQNVASVKILKQILISLPPLAEQKRIAAILDKADAIRKKRQQAVELADQFLKSVFMDMFGDPVTNPKGWDEKRLDNIASVRSGVTKGRQLYGKSTVSAPYMRVANVQDGHLNLDDIQHIEVLQGDIDRYRLMPGDLLLTEGGDRDKLGRGAVWQGEIKDCIHQNHIFCVRSDVGIICPEFLSAQIASQRGKRYFLKVGKQTTGIATINKTALSAYPALVPPMELQEKFIETLTKVHALVKKNKIWDQGIVSNFESLSQRAFKGDLTQTQAF